MKPGIDLFDTNTGFAPVESGRRESLRLRLGTNRKNLEGIFWPPEGEYPCLRMGVLGASGTGKTQLIQSLVTQISRRQSAEYPLDVVIFDYKGDYNESRSQFSTVTSAQIRRLRKLPFNPFDLSRQEPGPQLHVHTAMGFGDMVAHVYSLSPIQKSTLVQSVLAAYTACGITEEEESWSKPGPTMQQVYEEYMARPAAQRGDTLAEAMEELFQFDLFDPDGSHILSPEELRGIVVLDMSGYPPRIQNLITAVVLGLLWQALRRRFPQGLARMEKLVVVDEADEILGRDIPVVKRLLREGAQFGLGMILAAREPEHIDDDEKPCLDLWAVHSLEAPKRTELERIFEEAVPEQQMQELRKLQRHQCLLKSKGAGALSMQDLPFYEVSTDTRESYLIVPEPEPEKPVEITMPELDPSDFLASFDFAEVELATLEEL